MTVDFLINAISVVLIVITIVIWVWVEDSYIKGSKITCQWQPNRVCFLRVNVHFVIMTTMRGIGFSNTLGLVFFIWFHPEKLHEIEVLFLLPAIILIAVMYHIGYFFLKWSKTPNGR